jgi:hypothetical protein
MALHSNGGQGSPARLPVKQVDDERDHDPTSLFDHAPLEQKLVSGWFRPERKMVSSIRSRLTIMR